MNSIMGTFTLSLAVTALAACAPSRSAEPSSPHPGQAEPAATRPTAAIPVTLVTVEQLPAARPLRALGRVTHDRDLKLGFKTGGLVAEVLVQEGERVVAGQVVARLDPREIDAAIAQASAGLAKARRDLNRAQGLVDEAVIPGAQRDDAQTAARVAAAALEGARFNRETTVLTAPGPGVVVKRLAEPGEVLAPGAPALVIGLDATDGKTLIAVGVTARDAVLVHVGDRARVRLDGDVGEVDAQVVEVAPTLVPGTDQVEVTVALAETRVVPRGLVATVTFELERVGTLPAVPMSAIAEGEGRNAFVYALAPGTGANTESTRARVVRHAIVVERVRSDGRVLVRSGLEGVDTIVDAGAAWLDRESTVIVTPRAAGNDPQPSVEETSR